MARRRCDRFRRDLRPVNINSSRPLLCSGNRGITQRCCSFPAEPGIESFALAGLADLREESREISLESGAIPSSAGDDVENQTAAVFSRDKAAGVASRDSKSDILQATKANAVLYFR